MMIVPSNHRNLFTCHEHGPHIFHAAPRCVSCIKCPSFAKLTGPLSLYARHPIVIQMLLYKKRILANSEYPNQMAQNVVSADSFNYTPAFMPRGK